MQRSCRCLGLLCVRNFRPLSLTPNKPYCLVWDTVGMSKTSHTQRGWGGGGDECTHQYKHVCMLYMQGNHNLSVTNPWPFTEAKNESQTSSLTIGCADELWFQPLVTRTYTLQVNPLSSGKDAFILKGFAQMFNSELRGCCSANHALTFSRLQRRKTFPPLDDAISTQTRSEKNVNIFLKSHIFYKGGQRVSCALSCPQAYPSRWFYQQDCVVKKLFDW